MGGCPVHIRSRCRLEHGSWGRRPVGTAGPGRCLSVALALAWAALGLMARGAHATNPIVTENALPGSPQSQWDITGNGDPDLQGFTTDISATPGTTVDFKIITTAADYRLDIYRLGWYGGLGARHIDTVQPSVPLPQSQPPCLNDPATRLIDCGTWAVSASWNVPSTAVSGLYVAKLVRESPEDGRASHVFFVVRDDERHSDLLFQTSDTTWQAYNQYLNFSLYSFPRAFKVSYNRPLILRGNQPWDTPFNAEYPMLRWLERNGYDVSYTTSVDTARRGGELLEHQAFLSVGHDEYWSREQREAVEAARDAGVHLAFFSGNEIYWKTRWEPSLDNSHTPWRTLVCYKESQAGAKIDPLPNVWTGLWRDCQFSPPADGCSPENQLSGQMSWATNLCSGSVCGFQVPDSCRAMRLWRDTAIAALPTGQSYTMPPATLGFEWDYQQFDAFAPPGLVWLSSTTVDGKRHHVSLYRHPSGALVFGAGTIQWSWGLDDNHTRGRLPPLFGAAPDPAMQQATANLLAEMGAAPGTLQPQLVAPAPTGDTTPAVSIITSPPAGAALLAGPVLIQGTASDTQGVVGCVEVSVDGGNTWKRAQGLENWSITWEAPRHLGPVTLRSRAADDLGNLESPSPGITATVGGAPIEIETIAVDDNVYVNGQDSATIAVATRNNSEVDDFLSLQLVLVSNRGEHFEPAAIPVVIAPHTLAFTPVVWPVPAAGFPREFSVQAELRRNNVLIEVQTLTSAFTGMVLSRADLQTATGVLLGPGGCYLTPSACTTPVVGSIPYYGSLQDFLNTQRAFCESDAQLSAGRPLDGGADGLTAVWPALDATLDFVTQTAPVTSVIPSPVRAAVACHTARIADGLAPFLVANAAAAVDSLAAAAVAALDVSGQLSSNEFFVHGPAELKLGLLNHFTTKDAVALHDAGVFDIPGAATVWGHCGPQPRVAGSSDPNPHAVIDLEIRGKGTGPLDIALRHRNQDGTYTLLRYNPIPVNPSTILRATFRNDALYPWGFGIRADWQGDGALDDIRYPGGLAPSDAGANSATDAPPLALLPSHPNPFNPSTTIRYTLPGTGTVRITLHDMRGRQLQVLREGVESAGAHSVPWNGTLPNGRPVSSGVYVVRLETPWGSATQKLTLVR